MGIKKKLSLGIASAALGLSLVGGERTHTSVIKK
ncbi:TasA family protein [Halobacillus shinanisalinarum]|nr:TasA family protein [Halobacillus shinanisalinarum]